MKIISMSGLDIRLKFLLIVSIILLCVILIILFLPSKHRPSNYLYGRLIARSYLNHFNGLKQFNDLRLGRSFPVQASFKNGPACYDIKLVDKLGNDHGYMLVNLDKKSSPLLEFSAEGPSLTEQLKNQINEDVEFRVLWLSPTFTVALNEADEIIGALGDFTPDESLINRIKGKNLSQREILELIIKERESYLASFKKDIKEEWDFFEETGAKKKATELAEDTLPGDFNVYFEYFVEGFNRAPRFNQIEPNTGANNKGYHSGCGPTAWAMFIGHHDLLWTPELLRGSQNRNSDGWGPEDHPNHEDANNSYIDRILMDLGKDDYLDVYGCILNDSGCNSNGDMEKGFDYIEDELGHETSNRRIWESHSTSVNKTLKYIQLYHRPVLIRVPWHYCVALSFVINADSESIDRQWVQINTGWGSVKYLSSQYIERVWYVTHILPKTQNVYDLPSHKSPAFCTTETTLGSGLLDKIWMFWLSEDGKINYTSGTNGNIPDLANQKTMDVISLFTPAVCTDLSYIYLVFVDTDKKIQVMMYDLRSDHTGEPLEKSWETLRFPDITTDVRPAVTGGLNDWLTIAFCNRSDGVQKIASNKNLSSPGAWPTQLKLAVGTDNYWVPIYGVTWKTDFGVSLARYGDRTILSWYPRFLFYEYGADSRIAHWISDHDGKHSTYCGKNHPLIDNKHWIYGAPSLVVSNDTVFVTYKDAYDRITIDHIMFLGINSSSDSGAEIFPLVYQCAYLKDTSSAEPSIGFIQRENNNHPVLVVGWLNSENKVTIRILSIDESSHPLNYDGQP